MDECNGICVRTKKYVKPLKKILKFTTKIAHSHDSLNFTMLLLKHYSNKTNGVQPSPAKSLIASNEVMQLKEMKLAAQMLVTQ